MPFGEDKLDDIFDKNKLDDILQKKLGDIIWTKQVRWHLEKTSLMTFG